MKIKLNRISIDENIEDKLILLSQEFDKLRKQNENLKNEKIQIQKAFSLLENDCSDYLKQIKILEIEKYENFCIFEKKINYL